MSEGVQTGIRDEEEEDAVYDDVFHDEG
jgi:hypothetical protein